MNARSLDGRRILMVVAPTEFEDQELLEPKGVFEHLGARVEVASTAAVARGDRGAEITPDLVLEAPEIATGGRRGYDAIVVVGGRGAQTFLWDHGMLHSLLRLAHDAGAVIGATSLATPVLARAGLLQGVRATVFGLPHARHELERAGAVHLDDPVVVDRGIVTAAGPDAAHPFAEAVAQAVAGRPPQAGR
ncbi:MAG TPA: DJ-1/PfpI family protein [Thermodesulfobacteriota bacterium]